MVHARHSIDVLFVIKNTDVRLAPGAGCISNLVGVHALSCYVGSPWPV